MRSFLHDGKRLVITAPYRDDTAAITNGKSGTLESGNNGSLKSAGDKEDLKPTSPTSSTCSIAGSVNSTMESTR